MKSICFNCHREPLWNKFENVPVKSDYWSSYVLHHLQNLWSEDLFTDIQIVCSDGTVNAHKAVLYGSSLYFRAFLSTSDTLGKSHILKLTDFSLSNVKAVLRFIYSGEVLLNNENVMDIFLLTDYLQVAVLRETCLSYFKKNLSMQNCLSFYELSVQHFCHDMKLRCQEIAFSECSQIFSSANYLECELHTLQMIIQSPYLKTLRENDIFDAILAWSLYQPTRICHLPKLFSFLKTKMLDTRSRNIIKYISFKLGQPDTSCIPVSGHVSIRYNRRRPMLLAFLGTDGESIISSCEVYDFKDFDELHRRWKYTLCSNFIYESKENLVISAAPTKRMYAGVAMTNYKVYFLGGIDASGNNLKSCDMYSLMENKWRSCTDLPLENHGCGSAINNDLIYLIGGKTNAGCSNNCYAYNFEKETWQKKPSLRQKRVHLAAVSYNDCIYVSGGISIDQKIGIEGEFGTYLNSCEKYDPFSCSWIPIAPLLTSRAYHCMVVLNGYIYAIGGYNGYLMSSVERYEPMKNQWIYVNSCTYPKCSFGAVAFDQTIYTFGGIGSVTDSYARPLPYSEKYCELSGTWSMGQPLVRARFGLVPAILFRCSEAKDSEIS